MKIYIAGPLYSKAEKAFNLSVDTLLKDWGYDTFLPQRDGGIITELPDVIDGMSKYEYIFNKDINEMNSADVFLFLLDGRVPDEGACVALGNCFAQKKTCVGYKTDTRSLTNGEDNLMIAMALKTICHNETELKEFLEQVNNSHN